MKPYQHTARWIVRRDLGRLTVTGADAVSFLQALLTNDIAAVPVGGHIYAAYLTPQGRMISDMHVYRRANDVLLTVPATLAAALAAKLDLLIFSEDVQVADRTASIGQISVVRTDPQSPLWEVDDVFFDVGEEAEVFARLAAEGVVPMDEGTFEALRIEVGEPRFGVDMTEETIPLEAGLDERAISQTKGCYVGQEIIIRVLHRGGGRVAKRLMKIRFVDEAAPAPAPGTVITAGGVELGRITSSAVSVMTGRAIALGYIRREYAETGAAVSVGGTDAVLSGFAG
jgi:folate-binding protein YgfZ